MSPNQCEEPAWSTSGKWRYTYMRTHTRISEITALTMTCSVTHALGKELFYLLLGAHVVWAFAGASFYVKGQSQKLSRTGILSISTTRVCRYFLFCEKRECHIFKSESRWCLHLFLFVSLMNIVPWRSHRMGFDEWGYIYATWRYCLYSIAVTGWWRQCFDEWEVASTLDSQDIFERSTR